MYIHDYEDVALNADIRAIMNNRSEAGWECFDTQVVIMQTSSLSVGPPQMGLKLLFKRVKEATLPVVEEEKGEAT